MQATVTGLTDMSTICRVCMTTKGRESFVNLYEPPSVPEQITSLHEMLRAICASVFTKPGTDVSMPQNVCTGCSNNIVAAFRLYQQCIETDRLLGELLLAPVKQEQVCGEDKEDALMSCEQRENIKNEPLDLMDELEADESWEESDRDAPEWNKFEGVCKICSEAFEDVTRLSVHVKEVHSLFLCNECGELCKSVNALNHHKFKHKEKSSCPDCGKQFASVYAVQRHKKDGFCNLTLGKVDPRTCPICHKVQKTMYQLSLHIPKQHPEKMLICDICGAGSTTERGLKQHKKNHIDERTTFACTICNEEFPTKRMMRSHRVTHAGPHKCNVCDKVMLSRSAFLRHMRAHTGERNFACEQCPMRFITKTEKSHHMLTHTKEKNHVCDTCGSRFTKKNSLRSHIKQFHEGKRDFACSQCSYVCSKLSQLKNHNLTHTGEKPYKCGFCKQAFARSSDVRKHVARVHCDGMAYPCDRCDATFKLMTELRQHYSVHVGEDSADGEQLMFTTMAVMSRHLDKERQQQSQSKQ